MDAYKSDCVKDDKYNTRLNFLTRLPDKPPATIPFPVKALDFNDAMILMVLSNAAAPSINATIYKEYKKCPQLSQFSFSILESCLKHCVVPNQ